jgi:hypothetical protein
VTTAAGETEYPGPIMDVAGVSHEQDRDLHIAFETVVTSATRSVAKVTVRSLLPLGR